MSRPSLERVTFRGRCPACGQGRIFSGMLSMTERCASCGLNIGAGEIGDGPAFFGIVVMGGLGTLLAVLLEIYYQPPYWVFAAVIIPFVTLGSLLCLRFAKACILGLQYGANPEDFIDGKP